MNTYLGNQKVKIHINGIAYCLNLHTSSEYISGMLLSSDGFLLRDVNGIYLTVKDTLALPSSDNYRLQDGNELYLNYEE